MRARSYVALGGLAAGALAAGFVVGRGNGSALELTGDKFEVFHPRWRKGNDVYFLVPAPNNLSKRPIELISIRPAVLSPGLEFVKARIYEKEGFLSRIANTIGSGEGGWSTQPLALNFSSVVGHRVPGRTDLGQDHVVYLQFQVTADDGPVEARGVVYTYRSGLRVHSQSLNHSLQLRINW